MGETLVIHPGALGDLLLAIPALRALREDSGPLVLAAQPRIGALLNALGVVDGCRGFDSLGLEPLFVDDDAPTDVPALARATRVVSWFGARDPVFVRRLTTVAPGAIVAPPNGGADVTVWEHLLATVSRERPDRWQEPVVPARELVAAGRRALEAAGWAGRAPLLIVHPGAGGVAKRWPAEGFARAVEAARSERPPAVVVNAGPADQAAVEAVLATMIRPVGVMPEQPLPHLAGALHLASAYLGNDSGVSHLAAAVGTPALILFTQEGLPWRPWSHTAHTLRVATATLAPRDLDAVLSALRRLLDRPLSTR